MSCGKITKAKALADKYDLKNLLDGWRKKYPEETQLDGQNEPNPATWIHFRYTPPELTGNKMVWKLSADTKRTAVDRFLAGEQFKVEKSAEGVRSLRLANSDDADGWNCFEL